MAAEEGKSVNPGSWLGDGVEEFKKLPLWGKIAVIVLVVAGIGFAVYKYQQNAAANAGTSANSAAGSALGSSAAGGSQSPFPMVNGLPVLPTGTNPLYDPNGNLIGYQPTPTTPTPNPTPTPAPTPTPTPTPTSGPLIPYGMYNGPSFSNLKPGTNFSWGGTNYLLNAGGGGRLWGTPAGGGSQVLLYGPQSAYPAAATTSSTPAMMNNAQIYSQAAVPHISSAHIGTS